jgi:hypothetical protein
VKALTHPKKGFRNSDVRFFQDIKATVILKRYSMRLGSSTDKAAAANLGMKEAQEAMNKQFLFHNPGLSIEIKKEDALNITNSRKRKKANGHWLPNPKLPSPLNHEALSMPLHEEEYVDYKVKIISK